MKCPNCGNNMKDSYRCLRCGFQFKGVAKGDETSNDSKNDETETIETREVSDSEVHLSRKHGGFGGSIFDDIFGGGIFGGFGGFGGIGSVFGDLFGGIFDDEIDTDGYDDDPRYFDDFGAPIARKDVFDSESVEIDNFEIDDEQDD